MSQIKTLKASTPTRQPSIEFKLSKELKDEYQATIKDLDTTMTNHLLSLIRQTIAQKTSLMVLNESSLRNRKEIFNSVSIVDTYTRDIKIHLPKQLVDLEKFENSVMLDRVSSVLSLNKVNDAYKFCMGLMNLIDSFEKPTQIIFSETDDKGRISTKLFRNLFGNAIIFVLIRAIDEGHTIHTYTDSLQPVYTEHLFELLSNGISTSIHERTKVYDNLFFNKYNKGHFNQWLQWSFGLSRREPIEEFNRLLRKNSVLTIDKDDIVERSKIAIKNLSGRYTLFGLSENGLQLAITKIQKFIKMLLEYANDYNPVEKCKNSEIHDILRTSNKKCPLRCGMN